MNPETNRRLRIGAYVYMYTGFMLQLMYFAFYAETAHRPLELAFVILSSIIFFIIYTLINHILIKSVLSIKVLILFETLTLITVFGLFFGYVLLWNR